jgi:nicotinamidase-related amidase
VEIPRTLEEVCRPDRMALLVYDMQVGVVNQIADGAEVTARVAAVLEAARGAGLRIFFTRHMSFPKEVMGASQLRTAMEWQRVDSPAEVQPAFLRGSPEFEIVPELAPRPSEAVVDKVTMSAFAGTPLDLALRDCGLGAYAIAGVATEVGIEPTVRHSMDLGYYPVIVADACGSGDREAGERSLAALAFTGSSLQTDSAAFRAALSDVA